MNRVVGLVAALMCAAPLALASANPASAPTSTGPAPAVAVTPKIIATVPEAPGKPLEATRAETGPSREAAGVAAPPPPSPGARGPEISPSKSAAEEATKPAPPKPPVITLAIDIDLTRQQMTVKEYGKVVGSWPISSGTEGFRTPTGTFRPVWQSRMWFSKKYDNAPMPHAIFFNGGVAMHATQSTALLGRPASHGCVRQSPANAAKTYALVSKHGNLHTRIVVRGTPRDTRPEMAGRNRSDEVRTADRASRERGSYGARGFEDRYDSRRGDDGWESPATRRVVFIDAYGNRRVGYVAANDPRLNDPRLNDPRLDDDRRYRPRPYGGYYGGYYGGRYRDW